MTRGHGGGVETRRSGPDPSEPSPWRAQDGSCAVAFERGHTRPLGPDADARTTTPLRARVPSGRAPALVPGPGSCPHRGRTASWGALELRRGSCQQRGARPGGTICGGFHRGCPRRVGVFEGAGTGWGRDGASWRAPWGASGAQAGARGSAAAATPAGPEARRPDVALRAPGSHLRGTHAVPSPVMERSPGGAESDSDSSGGRGPGRDCRARVGPRSTQARGLAGQWALPRRGTAASERRRRAEARLTPSRAVMGSSKEKVTF